MTKVNFRNLIISLMFTLCCVFCLGFSYNAYAADELVTLKNVSVRHNEMYSPIDGDNKIVSGAFSFNIPESQTGSTMVVTLYNEAGNLLSYETKGEGSSQYREISLAGNVTQIIYTNANFTVRANVGYFTQYVLKYQATVTPPTGSTYTTEMATITVDFISQGIELSVPEISLDKGTTITDALLRSYISRAMINGANIDKSLIKVSHTINTNTAGLYEAFYSYTLGGITISETVSVRIVEEYIPLVPTITFEGETVTSTEQAPCEFELATNQTMILVVTLNRESENVVFTYNFDVEGVRYNAEMTNPTTYTITINPPTAYVGVINGSIAMRDSGQESAFETLYLKNTYAVSQPPVIEFDPDYEFVLTKNYPYADLDSFLRNAVAQIVEFDGSIVAANIIDDPTKLVITHSIENQDDLSVVASYTVTYTYTSQISGLVVSQQKTLTVENQAPTIDSIVVKVAGEEILNGASLQTGTAINFEIYAIDQDEDALTYYMLPTIGSVEQDQVDTYKFTYTPDSDYAGQVSIQIYCKDSEFQDSQVEVFTFTFVDNEKPVIVFKSQVVYNEPAYVINVQKNTDIFFGSLVDYVTDNVSTIANEEVTLIPVGFELDAQNRARFQTATSRSIKYSVSDTAGNVAEYLVEIVVDNHAPVAQDIDYGIVNYNTEVTIDLRAYTTDADNDAVTFMRMGYIYNDVGVDGEPVAGAFAEVNGNILTVRSPNKYVGKLVLQYQVTDIDNAKSVEKTIIINFADRVKPVLTETNLKKDFVKGKGEQFNKDGYFTIIDEIDGDNVAVTTKIYKLDASGNTIGSPIAEIDFNEIASYKITYEALDQSSNLQTASVTINVTNGAKPQIHLVSETATITIGSRFSIFDYIYKISDLEDGDKTSNFEALYNNGVLKINNIPESTDTKGTYEIKMYYVDSDSNLSETVTFTLVVEGKKTISPLYFIAGGGIIAFVIIVVVIAVVVRKAKMRV